jgi:hypothetical protein
MGIAALVLGIVGLLASLVPCVGMFAIPLTLLAVLFGALGLRRPKDGTQAPGRGMAIAGLVCGVLGTLIAIVYIYLYISVAPEIKKEFEKEMQRQEKKMEAERARLDNAGEKPDLEKPDTEKPDTEKPATPEPEKTGH